MPANPKASKAQTQIKSATAASAAQLQMPAKKGRPSSSKPRHAEQPGDEDEEAEADSAGEWEEASSDEDGGHEEDSGDEEEGSEDEGVDAGGMERLMKALGEDGLDDFDRASLAALTGEDEESRGDEGDEIVEEDASNGEEEHEQHGEAQEQNEPADEEEDAIPLDELDEVDDDVIPQQKIEIDNKIALERIRDGIKLDPSIPWTETLVVTYPHTVDVDVDDDLSRELAFYKQALHCAQEAKSLAAKHNFPFTRPSDYFAEMVKSDAHMERIRQRLLDETATIKRAEEKRKEREGKKFGKQVQLEKQKERERSKKEMEDRLKGLKRKRKGAFDNAQEDDGFDVAVEDAIADRPTKRARGDKPGGKRGPSREARDKKFGFGGPRRGAKQNTRSSTDAFEPRKGGGKPVRDGGKGGKKAGVANRPGKSRRLAARGRP
ncbi:uncharacterized protein PHACADRAFT_128420 [Phanerochaete carnosa HHB-10118-sp]|uniref:Uncharacterized protein n=1 Tax=Phanerochaete carnosa (strain HHB-10118-sp) TaxID=650164 RepID=K5VLA1_PHACS|nr:uncharacterized protein PHACADRAFT_128420 [Phanerochaete carnosa HHB-10118-sp]EKM52198.1 hypothetical protein PHACADRAFT_128420 [Phanerochaete carnosa HHB-10118-sp]